MSYKITVTEIIQRADQATIIAELEIYSQTLPELNLATLIKTINRPTRKKRVKAHDSTENAS
jgi:hypothetical protein